MTSGADGREPAVPAPDGAHFELPKSSPPPRESPNGPRTIDFTAADTRGGRRALKRVVGWVLASACVGLFAWEGSKRWAEIRAVEWRWGWPTAAAVVCIVLGHVFAAALTHVCLRIFGGQPRWGGVLRVHLISQAAKYLPVGGVMNVAAQTAGLGRLPGVGVRRGALAVVCMTAVVCSGGLTWFGLTLVAEGGTRLWIGIAATLALPAAIVVMSNVRLWHGAVRFLMRRRGANSAAAEEYPPAMSPGAVVRLASFGLASMGFFGLSLAFLTHQATPIDAGVGFRLVGQMSAAWVLGFVSFVVPAGLGVRDYSLMLMMKAVVPAPWPVVVPAVSRAVWLAAELACFAAASLAALAAKSRAGNARV